MKALAPAFCIALLSTVAQASDAPLRTFEVQYDVRYSAFRGDATVKLEKSTTDASYLYSVATKARGFARMLQPGVATETARFEMNEGQVVPKHYRLDDGGKKKSAINTEVEFDWENNVAHSRHEGTAADVELAPGILDRLSGDIAAMVAVRNNTLPGPYKFAEKNQLRHYEFRFLADEEVSVPAGNYRALKYERQRAGSSRSTLIWYVPELDYLPVRMVQLKRGKTNVTMAARSVEFTAGVTVAHSVDLSDAEVGTAPAEAKPAESILVAD